MAERLPIFERKEKQKEKLIVEVGSGSLPVVADTERAYREIFDTNPNARYVGVDIDEAELRHGKALQERNDTNAGRAHNDRISYVNAGANALPFTNASVDELILRNVLGDPDIGVEEKHEVLHEAARVLKKDALLKIIEVYTPLMVYEDDVLTFIDNMEGSPFSVVLGEDMVNIPEPERAADTALSKDVTAGVTFFGNQSFVRYYRRA